MSSNDAISSGSGLTSCDPTGPVGARSALAYLGLSMAYAASPQSNEPFHALFSLGMPFSKDVFHLDNDTTCESTVIAVSWRKACDTE